MSNFVDKNIICCVKMDGENTTAAKNYIHARSLDYAHHPSRDRVRALHGKIAHEIPEGWRLSIENLYAKHSIHYKNLKDYNYLFGIWNEKNTLISWDETKEWAELLDLTMCPILYQGKWDEKLIKKLYKPIHDGDECEGFVVRIRGEIQYRDFRKYVGKYVRKNHVNSETHWKVNKFIPNELSNGAI